MKEFKAKAYHRQYKVVIDVVGIVGLNTSDPRVQSTDTTMKLSDVDILLYTGKTDSKNNRLFESDLVEYPVIETEKNNGKKPKTIIRVCKIVFDEARFKLLYDKPVGINNFQVIEINYPDFKLCNKIGTIYDTQE